MARETKNTQRKNWVSLLNVCCLRKWKRSQCESHRRLTSDTSVRCLWRHRLAVSVFYLKRWLYVYRHCHLKLWIHVAGVFAKTYWNYVNLKYALSLLRGIPHPPPHATSVSNIFIVRRFAQCNKYVRKWDGVWEILLLISVASSSDPSVTQFRCEKIFFFSSKDKKFAKIEIFPICHARSKKALVC